LAVFCFYTLPIAISQIPTITSDNYSNMNNISTGFPAQLYDNHIIMTMAQRLTVQGEIKRYDLSFSTHPTCRPAAQ
jgi:hypothetical protein